MSSQFVGELDLCGVKECVRIDWNELDKLDVIQYIKIQNAKKCDNNRIFIGIAGGPGSGKTLFSKLLSIYLSAKLGITNICVSGDGYHYDNKTLIEKGIRDQKGLPNTMNDEQLFKDILKLKNQKSKDVVYLPIYDREKHDPVSNAIKIEHNVKIIIFEGLYMIYWDKVKQLFDYIVFIDASKHSMKYRLSHRKRKCGSTLKETEIHYERIDSKTTQITESGKYAANSIIKSDIIMNNDISNKHTIIKYKQSLRSRL